MSLYRVVPDERNLNDIDWQATPISWQKPCLVMADNEYKAAEYLGRETSKGAEKDQVSGELIRNPWRNPSLVSYHEVDPINDIPEEGWVELDGGA